MSEVDNKSINKENLNLSAGEDKKILDKPAETKEPDRIELANQAAERMEKANVELKKLLDRQERMEADRIVAGRATAGENKQIKEETPQEYAKRIMGGRV